MRRRGRKPSGRLEASFRPCDNERSFPMRKQTAEVQRRRDEPLNLRLLKEIEAELFARKSREHCERESPLMLEIEAQKRPARERRSCRQCV